jgi:hypothetical protein
MGQLRTANKRAKRALRTAQDKKQQVRTTRAAAAAPVPSAK